MPQMGTQGPVKVVNRLLLLSSLLWLFFAHCTLVCSSSLQVETIMPMVVPSTPPPAPAAALSISFLLTLCSLVLNAPHPPFPYLNLLFPSGLCNEPAMGCAAVCGGPLLLALGPRRGRFLAARQSHGPKPRHCLCDLPRPDSGGEGVAPRDPSPHVSPQHGREPRRGTLLWRPHAGGGTRSAGR
jgi:hypothetical protein